MTPQAIILILLGNAAHWSPSPEMAAVEQCSQGGGEGGGAVQPWDYTPYYYILMALVRAVILSDGASCLLLPLCVPVTSCVRPSL